MLSLPFLKNKKLDFKSGLLPALFVFLLLSFFALRSSINYGLAGEADNVRGWAWSSSAGWISFNCVNNGSCGSSDYGVRIGTSTMNFSGYAWSSAVGWISFSDTGAPDYSFNTHCPSFCGSGNNCTACLDIDTGKVWGWAHIVSLGSDGWIKFRDEADAWTGVYLDQSTPSSTWRGWAWNGNDDGTGIGWINFNCLESGICASSRYATWVRGMGFPLVDNMSAPNWAFEDACFASKGFRLSWDMQDPDSGAYQSSYRVIVNNSNSMASPLFDSGRRYSSSEQYSSTTMALSYSTPYYWWVMVWDNFGLASPWFQFNTATASSTLTDNIVDNGIFSSDPNLTFTTYRHDFPDVNFVWDPLEPKVGDNVLFTDQSNIYFSAAPSTPVPCDEVNCSWFWSGDGIKTNSTPTASSTVISMEYGDHDIYDGVVGPDGYACTSSNPIFIDLLPKWREVKPAD